VLVNDIMTMMIDNQNESVIGRLALSTSTRSMVTCRPADYNCGPTNGYNVMGSG